MFPIRKQKYNKKRFPISLILIIFYLNIFFGEKMNICAASIPFEGEGISFDSEGNLWMVTHDKAAVTGIRYTTLGWTIKRYNSPIAGNQSVRVKLETYCPDKVDPNNPEYLYGYFVIHKERIFQSINSAYPEWAQELYTNGGTVYLDGIMTVTQNGVKQGSMSEGGALSGEVYTTYSGIAGARNWRDKEGLKSHFDKSVYFPANPGMIEAPVEGDANMEIVTVTSGINAGNLSSVNRLWITSDEFEVSRAIPSSECVSIGGSLQKYYYQATYEHHYGTKAVPVTASVTYTLTWNDGRTHREQVTVTKSVEVPREYSYWKIRMINLCYLKNAEVRNGALPDGNVRLENLYYPNVTVQKNTDSMTLPETVVAVDGGVVAGGTTRPAIPDSDILPLIDNKTGKIIVKNDVFSVDGEIWMNGAACEEKTPEPVTLSDERKQSVQKNDIQIPGATVVATLQNGETATRTGVSSSGWSRVSYNGQTLYAVSSYLTTDLGYTAPAANTTAETTAADGSGSGDGLKTKFTACNDVVTAKIEVNLRTLPSVTNPDAAVAAVLKNGETVTRTGINTDYGWSRVDYNGQTLYCVSSYLTSAQ